MNGFADFLIALGLLAIAAALLWAGMALVVAGRRR